MTTKQETAMDRLVREEQAMDKEIESLEAEARELEAPARLLTWDEIKAGATEDLETRERRRGLLPRLIAAAKVKRLEIRREKYEQEMQPLLKLREEAHARLESATAKRLQATEEEGEGRSAWGDAHMRIESRERRLLEIDREISELRGEQQTNSSSPYEWTRQT